MPRLTNADYLQLHHGLRHLWFDHRRAFGLITSQQQRALHQFFLPTEDVPDAELLQHRRDVSIRWPSLPHRAGRATARLRLMSNTPDNGASSTAGSGRRLVVHAVLRPAPNLIQLVAALATVTSHVDDHPDAAPPRVA